MKILYEHWNPSAASAKLVERANDILADYAAQGYTLTLRQLYYQFVAGDEIPNTERSYKNLGSVITRARMAGLLDWEAIEDRNRSVNAFAFEESTDNLINDLHRYVFHDYWAKQEHYVEVWVEKEALGNVVQRACHPLRVPSLSCKGYLSASEAWRAGRRLKAQAALGKRCVVFHLGDHDPSGIDMTRDNRDRLTMFSEYSDVEVRRVALNMDQIDEYAPPPNPAKVTDSRAGAYIKHFGRESWELDALTPSTLNSLITDQVKSLIDWDAWEEAREEEERNENLLVKLAEQWPQIKGTIDL